MFRKMSKGKAFAIALTLAFVGWAFNLPDPGNICAGGLFLAAGFYALIWLMKVLRDVGASSASGSPATPVAPAPPPPSTVAHPQSGMLYVPDAFEQED